MDDLENGCLRALVSEILSEMIVGTALSKQVCEPWLLWEGITRLLELPKYRVTSDIAAQRVKSGETEGVASSRLEQFGLLSTSQGSEVGAESRRTRSASNQEMPAASSYSISKLFWLGVQYLFFAFTAVRAIMFAVTTSSGLPSRSKTYPIISTSNPDGLGPAGGANNRRPLRPLVSMSIWRTVGHLIELDVRMPWLLGCFSLLHRLTVSGGGGVGGTNSTVDRSVALFRVLQCRCNFAVWCGDWTGARTTGRVGAGHRSHVPNRPERPVSWWCGPLAERGVAGCDGSHPCCSCRPSRDPAERPPPSLPPSLSRPSSRV